MLKVLTEKNFNIIMATAVLLILAIPVGIANMVLGYIVNESPCSLCWWQRIGMILIGVLGMFILRYGPKIRYIALIYITSAYGLFMSLRHVSSHVANNIGTGFGSAILGVHTYTWGVFVYWAVIIVISIMMVFFRKDSELMQDISGRRNSIKELSSYSKIVIVISFIVIASNAFQAFFTNGIPPFGGKDDPERMTLNLPRAISMWRVSDSWGNLKNKTSLRGVWTIELPYIAGITASKNNSMETKVDAGPVENNSPMLTIIAEQELDFPKYGVASGIAYDPQTDSFAIVSTGSGIYFLDANLQNVTGQAHIDVENAGAQVTTTVDATFSNGELLGTGYNKTLFGVKRVPNSEVVEYLEWRTFLKTTGNMMPSWGAGRKRLTSVRAKIAYTLALAKDPQSSYLYTASVPNATVKQTIISKFDTRDYLLSAEAILHPSSTIVVKAGRSVDEYYITGMAFYRSNILAISKAFNSLLVIDPVTTEITAVYGLPDMGDVHSIAVKGDTIYVGSRKSDKDMVFMLQNTLLF